MFSIIIIIYLFLFFFLFFLLLYTTAIIFQGFWFLQRRVWYVLCRFMFNN